jgi:hypothetical protein
VQTSPSWDLRGVDYYVDGANRLYVLTLFFSVIWSLLAFLRFCWHTRPFQVSVGKTLRKLQDCLSEETFVELAKAAAQIPAAHLLRGFRPWSTLSVEQLSSHSLILFRAAGVEFRYIVAKLRSTSQNLRRLSGFVLIFSAIWLSHQLSGIALRVELTKRAGLSALSGALAELFSFLTVGWSVLAFVYLARWWMNSRLDYIEGEWGRFSARIETQARQSM